MEIDVMYIQGEVGNSLSFNEYRVVGEKPWGGGKIIDEFKIDSKVFDNVWENDKCTLTYFNGELYVNNDPILGGKPLYYVVNNLMNMLKNKNVKKLDNDMMYSWDMKKDDYDRAIGRAY